MHNQQDYDPYNTFEKAGGGGKRIASLLNSNPVHIGIDNVYGAFMTGSGAGRILPVLTCGTSLSEVHLKVSQI